MTVTEERNQEYFGCCCDIHVYVLSLIDNKYLGEQSNKHVG